MHYTDALNMIINHCISENGRKPDKIVMGYDISQHIRSEATSIQMGDLLVGVISEYHGIAVSIDYDEPDLIRIEYYKSFHIPRPKSADDRAQIKFYEGGDLFGRNDELG